MQILLTKTGGTDGLVISQQPSQSPGPGELLVRNEAVGVNFIDIYFRTGLYPLPQLPAVLGVEGAGVVEEVGAGVDAFSPGDRVAYAGAPVGAYASRQVLPQEKAVRLPADIAFGVAAASMLKGITTHMLLTQVHMVRKGSVLLVHAAAGGLGSFLTRWAKHLGATVVGTVGSDDKAKIAAVNGVDHVVVGRNSDFVGAVLEVTGGKGADLAIDGVGGATLSKTFACVRPFGTVASIGQAAGPVPPVHVDELGPRRSISLARPSVMAYAASPALYKPAAEEVISLLAKKVLSPSISEYPLDQAAQAQADLEAGRSSGSLVLLPRI